MPFDPTVPAINADLDADPIRDNFNALKTLIDAIPPSGTSGIGNLDGSGQIYITDPSTATVAIASWYNSAGTGKLLTLGAPLRIASDAGGTDAGMTVCWVAF